MLSPEPVIYIVNALSYLAECAHLTAVKDGLTVGRPPEHPGEQWVIDAARALDGEQEEDPDQLDQEFARLAGQVGMSPHIEIAM